MQDDVFKNDDKILIVPVPNPYLSHPPGDLTFISHHHHYGNGVMPMQQNAQMLEMQKALFATQALLIEQRNFNRALIQETKQLLGSRPNNVEAIEDKSTEKVISNGSGRIIDASYEILDDNQHKNENKINSKENEMKDDSMDKKALAAINKSLEKQLVSTNEPPYYLQGDVNGTREDSIITAPVIFTIRNNIWRSRVRYIMKEYYYDNKSKKLRKENNQENNSMAVVVLYNSNKVPVEVVVIYQLELKEYLNDAKNDNKLSGKYFEAINMISKFIPVVMESFGINLEKYFVICEPVIDSNTPVVIDSQEGNMLADLVKIKPVLSFTKEDQRISVRLFERYTYTVKMDKDKQTVSMLF